MVNQEIYPTVKTEPRFFYGYVIVAAAFFIMIMSFGINNSFGVFFKPLQTEFGWTSAETSGAFSLSMVVFALLSIIMGGLNDRLGPRVVVTVCGFFFGLGCLLMSQISTLWHIYVFFGVMIGIGRGGIRVPLLSTVTRWFAKRRGLMIGIVLAGVGIGRLIAPLVFVRLIVDYGWRFTYVVTGITLLIVILIAAQFLRRDPTQKGLLPYGKVENKGEQQYFKSETESLSLKEAILTAQFWLFFMIWACFGFFICAVMVHIVPHAIDLGISTISAANILATIGGTSIIGNLALGSLGDRIGNRKVYLIGFILSSAALCLLVFATELWMLYLFAVVLGFAEGGMGAQSPPLLARLFGLDSHGLLLGVVGVGFRIGSALGPIVTGYIFDLTGSYQVAFWVCAFTGVVGLILSLTLRPTKKLGGRI